MTADQLKKKLKFAAIFLLVTTYLSRSFMQVVCDLANSKDGTLLGPQRKSKKDKQVVKVILTTPDLLFSSPHPVPRYAPLWIRISLETTFRALYGYDLQIE